MEPLIADSWPRGREQSRHGQRMIWTRMADDGSASSWLRPGMDIDTAAVLAAAETYLLTTRMMGWDLDTYEAWLATALLRLAAIPSPD